MHKIVISLFFSKKICLDAQKNHFIETVSVESTQNVFAEKYKNYFLIRLFYLDTWGLLKK